MRFRTWHLLVALVGVTALVVVFRGDGDGSVDGAAVELVVEPAGAEAGEPASEETVDIGGDVHTRPEASADTVGPLEEPTAAGALRSVLIYLELSEELILMSPQDAGETQRLYATAASADQSSSEITRQVEELQAAAGPDMHLDVAPISWTITEVVDGSEYVVTVWYVEVFSLGEPGEAYGAFKTYTASVQWEGGSWKLNEAEVLDGPQPIVGAEATSGTQLRSQLVGFSDGGQLVPFVVAAEGS